MGDINKIKIQKKGSKINLKVIVIGEKFDEKRHELRVEIKAVTFHQMEIKNVNNEYSTRIVFDI